MSIISSRPTEVDENNSLTNTSVFRRLTAERVEIGNRIATIQARLGTGTPEEVTRDQFWINQWRKEHAALSRALWSLGDEA